MLRKVSDIFGFHLGARDGEIGRVKDIYFEDQHWVVRYLVADTNKWLAGRKVLLAPHAVKGIRDHDKIVDIDLTRKQIEDSPSIDQEKPVSRQFEEAYYTYYQWPAYWQGAALWGPIPSPAGNYAPTPGTISADPALQPEGDPHLRTVKEVQGYHIRALDGEIGHVEDMAFDDDDWSIRYVVVDTRNWWAGKKALVAVDWVREISFQASEVHIDLDRQVIQNAPEYDFSGPISREFETRLFAHYGREPYWSRQKRMAA